MFKDNLITEAEMSPLTTTANGAIAYQSTGSALLDFFAQAGSWRQEIPSYGASLFKYAYAENPLGAMKTLFYLRDIRGGQGTRNAFRIFLHELGKTHPDAVQRNIPNIPEYGRWDDLFALWDTPLQGAIVFFIHNQLQIDQTQKKPSLLAKWLPSENASSPVTIKRARQLAHALEMSMPAYRRMLVQLRKKICIVETAMASQTWDQIDYAGVPSLAMMRYRNAFRRQDGERFSAYLENVEEGAATIHAGTLTPYDIIHQLRNSYGDPDEDRTLEAQWVAIPNYFDPMQHSALCVVDVSGSMYGTPLDVALSLGIYCGERMQGQFHNTFITFSEKPQLQTIKGKTLRDKIEHLSQANWDMNTNIEAVFKLILKTAVKYHTPAAELPEVIFIISDMEFDDATNRNPSNNAPLFEQIRQQYAQGGYVLPKLVFWNVNGQQAQFPAAGVTNGAALVSGYSPSLVQSMLALDFLDPVHAMWTILDSPRYDPIRI